MAQDLSTASYADIMAAAAAKEFTALQPVQTAYAALQTAVATAQTALAGGGGVSRSQQWLINATNNATSLKGELDAMITAMTPPPAPASAA